MSSSPSRTALSTQTAFRAILLGYAESIGVVGRVQLETGRLCRMPTVLRVGPYRFFFFSNEGREPPLIHIKAGDSEAKFWWDPVALASNYGFNNRQLNEVEDLVGRHRDAFLEAWHEHLG